MARVLIVEDAWLRGIEIAALLASSGHTICETASCAAALDAARTERPDVVVMDARLPDGRDGIDSAAQIQAACSCALVFVTPWRDAAATARMRRLQPAAIVGRPANGDMILGAVDRMAREV
jgi:DNA-binding NarL/FixJ family response regulator